MSADTFHLILASVGETLFDGAVVSVTFPGAAGEFTVLPHHEALVTTMKAGSITVRLPAPAGETATEERSFPITGGVVECSGNRAVVLL